MKTLCILALAMAMPLTGLADDKIGFTRDETTTSVLRRHTGQRVELVLKSGEKVGGKVEALSASTVHLSGITGKELFEAVVEIDDVSVVLIRADGK
jgi:hypothetical protein